MGAGTGAGTKRGRGARVLARQGMGAREDGGMRDVAARRIASDDLEHILEGTRPLWEEMRGERLFVTGGTGFFGCWMMESFCHINQALGLGAAATILTRDPAAFRRKLPHVASDTAITLLAGDVRSFVFPAGRFRFILHAATEASARQSAEAPLEMLTTILKGTERTLEFAAACGARKFLLTSSGAVYGRQPSGLTHVPETYEGAPDPLDPASVYAEGKRASELMCALYQKVARAEAGEGGGLECKIARCWAFCGAHLPLDAHFAIGNFIGDVLAGRSIQIGGDGTPRRSYLYASDLAVWLWTILFQAPALAPFNVGSANDVSILELARTVASTLGAEGAIHVAKQPIPGAEVSRYVPSVERARMLGLGEAVGLREAIQKTAEWYRQ